MSSYPVNIIINYINWIYGRFLSYFRDVAQSGSVPASGAGGRGFKSRRPDHFKTAVNKPFLTIV